MIDKRYFRYFDWVSFGLMLLLLTCGLTFVFSATYTPEQPVSLFFKKQLFGVFSGLCIYVLFCIIDFRRFIQPCYLAYYVVLVVLLYTTIGGLVAMGGKRWVSLYFFRFQPSELAKLLLPMFFGFYFSEHHSKDGTSTSIPFKAFLFPLGVLFLSFILIRSQPDLGTALIVLFSGLIVLWFIGLPKKFFLWSGILILLAAPVLWKCLKPYQQKRILVLFGYGDAKRERYQVEQSKIAIGSGGFCGKGFLKGTQSKLQFLPEDHTDFIFAVICEEIGFVGAFFILLLFFLLFIRLLSIIYFIPLLSYQAIGLGLMIHICLSVFINIGMVMGILPVVGISLPMVSYGIANLWVTMASLGWLNNIAIRRFYY